MMTQKLLHGVAASGGLAMGSAVIVTDPEYGRPGDGGPWERLQALDALARLAEELALQAATAREEGRLDEADILMTNRLIVEDPALKHYVEELAASTFASDALLRSTERYAAQIERIPDAGIAVRGTDVRQLGRRSVRLLNGSPLVKISSGPTIVVARDLGPADLVELEYGPEAVQGIALAGGSAISHVAITARSLGVPLVVGIGNALLQVKDGDALMLDGDTGRVVVETDGNLSAFTKQKNREGGPVAEARKGIHHPPLATRDNRPITLLCNAGGAPEVAAGVANGAEGVGLLRTELAFLQADSWPTRLEHEAALQPTFSEIHTRVATIRTLDFGFDKLPPFLAGTTNRGLALTLAYPDALRDQLWAIVTAGARSRLRVLFPFVQSIDDLAEAKCLLTHVVREIDRDAHVPLVGAMIETLEAVAAADAIAAGCDFLAIGTNDLVRHSLELDQYRGTPKVELAADPEVLALVLKTIEVAHARGRRVEICGEAAGVPSVMSLFLGLGVDELSMAPARLAVARRTLSALTMSNASTTARRALSSLSVDEALAIAAGLLASVPIC